MNIVLTKDMIGEEKPGHKYIRKYIDPKTGKRVYVYKESEPRQKKVIPVRRRPEKIEYVPEVAPKVQFKPEEKKPKHSTVATTLSDRFFGLSEEDRAKALNEGKQKLQDFVAFIRERGIGSRAELKEYVSSSGREVLSRFFGLTNKDFESESGDKLSNYVDVSFSKDGKYITLNYADNFFFKSINREIAESKRPKWSMQMRMVRGITFDKETGEMVSFPYEKFFNMDEYIDGNLANLAKKMSEQPFLASEKVGGILIQAFYDKYTDKIRFGTRAQLDPETDEKGFLDTAEKIVRKGGQYDRMKDYLKDGRSMVLELIDPKYRVVVGYGKKSALFLHGVRDLKTSKMQDFLETQRLADSFGIESPKTHEFHSFDELSDFQKNAKEDLEGFVIRFKDGSMIKAKTESYFRKLKGLRSLSYKAVGDAILNNEDWNLFKYEKIKSEELFSVADKYRADILKESDVIDSFLLDFADKILAESQWDKYGTEEKAQTINNFSYEYDNAVRSGIINPSKVTKEDFRIAVNYLMSARITKDDKFIEGYNKKLMQLTIKALKTDAWMGEKLNELERSYTEMTLFKDFGSVSCGQPAAGGLSSVASDKGKVTELDDEVKQQRKRQSRFPN